MKIIAYSGVVGSGKDYQAKLRKQEGFEHLNFADSLREFVWLILNWQPKNDDEYEVFKNTKYFIEYESCNWPMGWSNEEDKMIKHYEIIQETMPRSISGRDLLIGIGDKGRKFFGEDVWIKKWMQNFQFPNERSITLSDCRYINEAKQILVLEGSEIRFCNYKSQKYNPNIDSRSEALSQWLIKLGFEDQQQIFLEDILEIESDSKFQEFYNNKK